MTCEAYGVTLSFLFASDGLKWLKESNFHVTSGHNQSGYTKFLHEALQILSQMKALVPSMKSSPQRQTKHPQSHKKYKNMGVSKNRGTPKSSILTKFPLFSPSILGYPYFWKHPHPNANDLAWRTAPDHQPCKPWLGECLGCVFFPQGTPTYPLEHTPDIPKLPQMKGIPS